jgi:hypothetical protein
MSVARQLQLSVAAALAGDTVALRLALERICPPRRDRAATFALRPIHSARDAAEAQSDLADAVSFNIITPAEAAEISKVLANAAKAYEIAEMAERAQLEQMTDTELLRVIAMGGNGADIAKQVSGLLTNRPALNRKHRLRRGRPQKCETQMPPDSRCQLSGKHSLYEQCVMGSERNIWRNHVSGWWLRAP